MKILNPNFNVGSLVYEVACQNPEIQAIRYKGSFLTYRDLNYDALLIASFLLKQGAENKTIGILGERNITSLTGVLGSIYAGCSYTPLNTNYPQDKVSKIIKEAEIRYIICQYKDLSKYHKIFKENNVVILMPSDETILVDKNLIFKEQIKKIQPLSHPKNVCEETNAYILYTSGTTGNPKGVQVSHANLISFLSNMTGIYELPRGFRASQTFDLSFDLSVCDLFFTWTNAGTLCLLSEEDRLLPSDYINREEIYFWYSVPTLASIMNKFGSLKDGVFPTLKYSLFCGEPFPLELAKKWSRSACNSTVENLYGPSEATIHLTRRILNKQDFKKKFYNGIMPIGRPFADHFVKIVNKDFQLVKNGEVGQLVLSGPQITKGYLKDKIKTKKSFVRLDWDLNNHTWYLTGDLGFFNSDGDLEFFGRNDSQIKLAGRRVELGEIEYALRKYPQLEDIIILPDRNKKKEIIGVVGFTMSPINDDTIDLIRSDSTRLIESIFFPRRIITISKFPTSDSGKISRKKLLAKYFKEGQLI